MWRLGIVDFDSSHSVELTRRFNRIGVGSEQFVDGAEVVLAWPGSSDMAPERIPGFRREIEDMGIELVSDVDELIGQIDAVLVLSLCGSAHLDRARPFLETGVPTFVDKPFACSVSDAEDMVALANQHNTLLFNASALRFSEEAQLMRERQATLGPVNGAVTYGPSKRADGNPGLFHYGIHSVELLFELMGTGCTAVTATSSTDAKAVTGLWSDGRIGTVRGVRTGATRYGFTAFCEHAVVNENVSTRYAYRNLCRAILQSFDSGETAVSHTSNLEVIRFVAAAIASEEQGGRPIELNLV